MHPGVVHNYSASSEQKILLFSSSNTGQQQQVYLSSLINIFAVWLVTQPLDPKEYTDKLQL